MHKHQSIAAGIFVVFTLAAPTLASADLTHQTMEGPAKRPFDVCARVKAKQPDASDATCTRVAQGTQKPFTAVEVWSVESTALNGRQYYLSVQTAAGWFITSEPLVVSGGDASLGHGYDLDSAQVTLRQLAAGRGRAVAAALTLAYKYWSQGGDRHSRKTYQAFILAGIGTSGPRSLILDGFECAGASVSVKGGYLRRGCQSGDADAAGMFNP